MKKLINKLFEWLGYVPRLTCRYEVIREVRRYINSIVCDNKVEYKIEFTETSCKVVLADVYDWRITIKEFPFKDDFDYAKLCAEELCEMLNQKI